jgi:hypothetical protein
MKIVLSLVSILLVPLTLVTAYQYTTSSSDFSPSVTPQHVTTSNTPLVLGETTENLVFSVNVPARFAYRITAPNIIYQVTAGLGMSVSEGQTPIVTNTGVLTLGSGDTTSTRLRGDINVTAGDGIAITTDTTTNTLSLANTGILSLTAGTGIEVDGNKITNTYTFTPDYTQGGWKREGTVLKPSVLSDSVEVGALTTTGLTVNGSSTLNGSLTVNGLSVLSGSVTIGNGVAILPNTDLGSDLGSSTYRFNNLWVANINSNSSQSFSGQTTFSYPPTDDTISQASVLINPTTSAPGGQLLGLAIAGYQKAMIDSAGNLTLGYQDQTSAPTSSYPLNIYGHSGTRVAYISTNGIFGLGGETGSRIRSDSNGLISILGASAGYGGIKVKDGTADAPGYSFGNYEGLVGMYTNSGSLAFSTNAIERIRITTTGSIGIGTTNPGSKIQSIQTSDTSPNTILEVPFSANTLNHTHSRAGLVVRSNWTSSQINIGALWNSGYIQGTSIGGGGSRSIILNPYGTSNVGLGAFGVDSIPLPTSRLHIRGTTADNTASGLNVVSSADTSLLFVRNDGNVGIGTTDPNYKLRVQGGGAWINNLIISGGNPAIITTQDVELRLQTNGQNISFSPGGTEKVRMTNAGLVGIGTTSPGSKLEVANGNIALTGASNVGLTYYNASIKFSDSSGSITYNAFTGNHIFTSGLVGIGTTAPTSKLHIVGNSDIVQSIIKGHNSQTANLQEWQNSSGTSIASISSDGKVTASSIKIGGSYNDNVANSIKAQSATWTTMNGTVSVSGTAVTGEGTSFLTDFKVGDEIGIDNFSSGPSYWSVVTNISSNTTLTTERNWGTTTGSGYKRRSPIFIVTDNSNNILLTINGSRGMGFGGLSSGHVPSDFQFNSRSSFSKGLLAGNLALGTATRETALYTNSGSTALSLIQDGVNGHINIETTAGAGQWGIAHILIKTNGAERMRVTNDGLVGIGTTAPGEKLEVAGNIKTSSLTTGTVYSNAGVLTNTDPSDAGLKDNVLDLSSGTLARLMNLRAVSFNWKSTGDGALGFIAQEVRDIFPELVGTNADGSLGLYTTQFIPVLTRAIQEQQLQIDSLRGDSLQEATERATVAYATTEDISLLQSLIDTIQQAIASLTTRLDALADQLFTKKIRTEELCIGSTSEDELCLTRDQVQGILDITTSPTSSPSATPTPSVTPTLDPIIPSTDSATTMY